MLERNNIVGCPDIEKPDSDLTMSLDGEKLQRSLLDGEWRKQPGENPVAQLCKQVIDGEFKEALCSPLAREMLTLSPGALNDLSQPTTTWFAFSAPSAGGAYEEELVRLFTAVACLHAFLQANWTGPPLDDPVLPFLDAPTTDTAVLTAETLQHKAVSELKIGRAHV